MSCWLYFVENEPLLHVYVGPTPVFGLHLTQLHVTVSSTVTEFVSHTVNIYRRHH